MVIMCAVLGYLGWSYGVQERILEPLAGVDKL